MKPAVHQYEDKLLELAYGELPPGEASAVESHVRTCARCTEALSEIRNVRSTMGQLPMEPVPDTGLESLFAYADQAARRNAAGPAPVATWWRKLMAPMMAAGALSLVGVVAYMSNKEGPELPSRAAVAEQSARKVDSLEAAPIAAAPPPAPVAAAEPEAQQVWQPEEAKKEYKQEAQTKVAAKPAPAPAKKMAGPGAGSGEELGASLDRAKKRSASKNEKEDLADNSSNAIARGGKSGYVANDDDAALAKKAEEKPSESNKDMPSTADKSPFGVTAGNSGGAQPRAAPQAEQVAPSAPPPPPLQAQAPPSDGRTSGGSMGVSMNQQQRGGMSQGGSLGERERRDESSRQQQAPAVAAAARPADVVADLNQRVEDMKRARIARDTDAEITIALDILRTAPSKSLQRMQALASICNGFYALEEPSRAEPYCQSLLREYPSSSEARAYAERSTRARPAAKRKASQNSYDMEEAAPAPAKPAEQRQSEPAQAY